VVARILLISDEEAVGLLWGASTGGHDVYVTGVLSRNPTVSVNPKCKKFLPLPEDTSFVATESFPELAIGIADLARSLSVDVIVPTSFESVKFAISERQKLEEAAMLIPLATMDIVNLLDDKHSFFKFCVEHGLPHPASCLLSSSDDLNKQELQDLRFPLLTKPIFGAAEGIERFETSDELRQRVATASADFFPVLAQEWFDGEDIDFNGYALNGVVQVESVMRTTFYRHDNKEVSLTDFVRHPEISSLGNEIVRKSNYTGPLNIDLRIRRSDNKILLIEVNPRFWGRSMACLIDGLNFIDAAINLTTNPEWRRESRSDGRMWASSIMPLLRGALRGDRAARQYLSRLSATQIKFQIYMKCLRLWSRFKGRST
tara:strand:- start:416 stop:1534 length:1119 start_codon:yes stop_codon:yes gene_type:complete